MGFATKGKAGPCHGAGYSEHRGYYANLTMLDGQPVRHLGCFRDDASHSPLNASIGAVSPPACAKATAKAGYNFFAFHNGNQCFTVRTKEQAMKLGEPDDCKHSICRGSVCVCVSDLCYDPTTTTMYLVTPTSMEVDPTISICTKSPTR